MKKLGLILVLGLAAVGVFLVFRPRPVPPPRVLHPTVRQAALARQHVEGQIQQLVAAAPPGPRAGRPRTLRISEDDLNVYLASSRQVRKLLTAGGVQAVQVMLQEPSNLSLRATLTAHGHPQNVQIDGALAPDPQLGLRFTATHAQVGRLPLPAKAVTAQANALAARFSKRMAGRLSLDIQSVQVQGKQLVLTGVPITRRVAAIPQ